MDIRKKIKVVVFGTDTRAGRLFDIILLWAILFSIGVIMLESIPSLNAKYHYEFRMLEWIFTGLFTLEYLIRIWVVDKKRGYIFSFFGIIDFLSVLPSYIGLFVPGYNLLLVIRAVRLLRIFRIFQLTAYLKDSAIMGKAMLSSMRKIIIFLSIMVVIVMILGTLIYVVEGAENGFTSIPRSIYWAVVTITTVGYGNLTPATPMGEFIATVIMLLGYAIIAVPTGIVSAEMVRKSTAGPEPELEDRVTECPKCGLDIYDKQANYCRNCGTALRNPKRKSVTDKKQS